MTAKCDELTALAQYDDSITREASSGQDQCSRSWAVLAHVLSLPSRIRNHWCPKPVPHRQLEMVAALWDADRTHLALEAFSGVSAYHDPSAQGLRCPAPAYPTAEHPGKREVSVCLSSIRSSLYWAGELTSTPFLSHTAGSRHRHFWKNRKRNHYAQMSWEDSSYPCFIYKH